MLKKSIFMTLFVFLFLTQGCYDKKEKKKEVLVPKNEYVLKSLKDEQLTVIKTKDGFKLKGKEKKIVIFDIFATWCPPCRRAASHLNSIQKKYKDDVVVIGTSIEYQISKEKLKEFRKVYGANYTLIDYNNRTLADNIVKSLNLGERYPIPIVAIYKDGKYISHYVGSVEEEFIESDIKRALKR